MSLQKQSDEPLFAFRHVTVLNEGKLALKNITANFYPGKVYSIFGEHGSGKTTLCKTIMGESKPHTGKLLLNGHELKKYSLKKSKYYRLFNVDQNIFGPENLSVSDYFFLTDFSIENWLYSRNKHNNRKVKEFLQACGIAINPDEQISSLSFQQKVIIDIFQKVYMNPRLLILDETIDKLSQEYREIVFETVKKMRHEGKSVLIVTHDIHDAHKISDRILIMRNGEIIFRDSINSVDDISIIRMAYTQALSSAETFDNNTNFYSLLKFNQAILEELPISLMVFDTNNIVRISNSYARNLFGSEELNKKDMKNIFSDNIEIYELIIRMSNADSVISNQEISFKTADTFRILNITVCPVFDNTVKIGSLLFMNDVSEHEFLRQQIIQSEKYTSLGIFTSGIAHEINNPLEIIINCLDYLNINIRDENFRKKISYIEEEIDRISDIIKDLGSFTRPGMSPSLINIRKVLSELIELMMPYSVSHNTVIRYNPGESDTSLFADIAEIKQVLLNIIKNSIDAINENGIIKICDRIFISDDTEYLQIIIEDNGPGIPESEIPNLFLPFYTTKSHENMGLGLYISYQIISKYDGKIYFEKALPEGTRCIIELPLNA